MTMINAQEIEKRKSLWIALADLWLDTEPTDSTYQMVVQEMRASGYPLEQIERIYAEEVAPSVYTNLLNTTGVWGAFDTDWLCGAIIKNLKKQENNLFYRVWIRSVLGRYMVTKMVRADWQKIIALYNSPECL